MTRDQVQQMLGGILQEIWGEVGEAMGLLNRYQLRNDVPDDLAAEADRAEEGLKRAYMAIEKAFTEAGCSMDDLPPQARGGWTWEDLEAAVARPDGDGQAQASGSVNIE